MSSPLKDKTEKNRKQCESNRKGGEASKFPRVRDAKRVALCDASVTLHAASRNTVYPPTGVNSIYSSNKIREQKVYLHYGLPIQGTLTQINYQNM